MTPTMFGFFWIEEFPCGSNSSVRDEIDNGVTPTRHTSFSPFTKEICVVFHTLPYSPIFPTLQGFFTNKPKRTSSHAFPTACADPPCPHHETVDIVISSFEQFSSTPQQRAAHTRTLSSARLVPWSQALPTLFSTLSRHSASSPYPPLRAEPHIATPQP